MDSNAVITELAKKLVELGSNKPLMKSINPAVLRAELKKLKTLRQAMSDPDMPEKLEHAMSPWFRKGQHKHTIYLLFTLAINQHSSHQQASDNASTGTDNDDDSVDATDDESETAFAARLVSGMRKYTELFADVAGIKSLRDLLPDIPIFKRLFRQWDKLINVFKRGLFIAQTAVSRYQEIIDDKAYELVEEFLRGKFRRIPGHQLIALIVFVIALLTSFVLTVVMVIMRPAMILDILGIDSEDIPFLE